MPSGPINPTSGSDIGSHTTGLAYARKSCAPSRANPTASSVWGARLPTVALRLDQKDTYPYQLEQILKQKGENPQVLNASAGGWTLTNEAAFLQDKGTFDAKFVVLEGGTRELYQGSDLKSLDGADPNLPGHRPPHGNQ